VAFRRQYSPGCPCCTEVGCAISAYFGLTGCCGRPLVGATVTVTGPSPATTTFTGTTGADGACSIDLAPGGAGSYSYSIVAAGYVTITGAFTAACGRNFAYGGPMVGDATTWPDPITVTDPAGNAIDLHPSPAPPTLNPTFSGSHAYTLPGIVIPGPYGCGYYAGTGTATVLYGYRCGLLTIRVPVFVKFAGSLPLLADDSCANCYVVITLFGLVTSYCRPIAATFSLPDPSASGAGLCYPHAGVGLAVCPSGPSPYPEMCRQDLVKLWTGANTPFDVHS
jgi:hypothetical protein